MVTPHMITAPLPMDAPFRTRVGTIFQSASVCNASPLVARGYASLMNMTPWPTNTSSSISTPSQMNVCDEILHSDPIVAFF
jgi:hypothetical protein